MKKVFVFWGIAVLLGGISLFLFSEYNKRETATQCSVITKQLYLNNEVYVGDLPLLKFDNEIYVPVELILTITQNETFANMENVETFNDVQYISLSNIEEVLNLNVIEKDVEIFIDSFGHRFDYSWTENMYVAHAFGAIGTDTYTNSLEAFLYNYEIGHRVFEVDLTMTSDNRLVVLHDWSKNTVIDVCGLDIPEDRIGEPLSHDEFLQLKIKGQYTTLDFEDILEIMREYPDIYIITDTKETQEPYISQQFQYMVDAAGTVDVSLLERIIPQIYNEAMFESIMELYDWNSIIYTMYNQGRDFSAESVVDFTYRNGIEVITTYEARAQDIFLNELLKRNRVIYMNTFNDEVLVDFYQDRGVYGFYTDFLSPM